MRTTDFRKDTIRTTRWEETSQNCSTVSVADILLLVDHLSPLNTSTIKKKISNYDLNSEYLENKVN